MAAIARVARARVWGVAVAQADPPPPRPVGTYQRASGSRPFATFPCRPHVRLARDIVARVGGGAFDTALVAASPAHRAAARALGWQPAHAVTEH